MSKRRLSKVPQDPTKAPDYPTLDEFDRGRRSFLGQLGAALLGAGTISAVIAGCGDRLLKQPPDDNPEPLDGSAPAPDARIETRAPEPDAEPLGGVARPLDARIDTRVLKPDAEPDAEPLAGVPLMPDARIDTRPARPDFGLAGGEPQPDARLDSWPKK
jgi:hypothetical protein